MIAAMTDNQDILTALGKIQDTLDHHGTLLNSHSAEFERVHAEFERVHAEFERVHTTLTVIKANIDSSQKADRFLSLEVGNITNKVRDLTDLSASLHGKVDDLRRDLDVHSHS